MQKLPRFSRVVTWCFVFIGVVVVVPQEARAVNYEKGTIAMWIKPNWDGYDGNTYFIFQGNALSSTDNNSIKLYKDSLNFIHGEVWGNDGIYGDVPPGDVSQTSTNQWRSGVWHHVALSWDSSTVELKLYIDGALRAMTDSNDISEEEFPQVSQGSDYEGIYRDNNSYVFNGEITQVRKYDTPQSDSTIVSLAATTPAERATATAQEEAAAADAVAAIDQVAPTFSSIAKKVSYTTAAITWTTNESADTQVEYGLTTAYGMSSLLSTTSVTNHTVSLAGLKPATTYHFIVKSKDAANNQGISSDNTFKTLKPAVPSISLNDPGVRISKNKVLVFSGTSTSAIDSQIEISMDGGSSWYLVGEKGSGSRSYSFVTPELEDGNYSIVTRVTDDIKQITTSTSFEVVVDTLPPRLGGVAFFLGPQKVLPAESGILRLSPESAVSLVVSVVGGPIKVEVNSEKESFSLSKLKGTNLWRGEVSFQEEGIFNLEAVSEDGAGNVVRQTMNPINVLRKGRVKDSSGSLVDGAEIFIYVAYENGDLPEESDWQLWDSVVYGQENPQMADGKGEFFAFLPSGRYKLVVKKEGFRDFVSEPFSVLRPAPFNPEVVIEVRPSISIIGWQLSVPWYLDFGAKMQEVKIEFGVEGDGDVDMGVGRTAKDFVLPTATGGEVKLGGYTGRKVLISFWATWDLLAAEQVAVLSSLEVAKDVVILPVAMQESKGKVWAYLRRGGYLVDSLVDNSGVLFDDYRIFGFPQHILVGEDGRIKKATVSVMSKEELIEFIDV